jgi:hypothetical protein
VRKEIVDGLAVRELSPKPDTSPNPDKQEGGTDMTQAYSDPTRESDPHALPDIEVFYVTDPSTSSSAAYNRENADHGDEFTIYDAGWYWWSCFPGCIPDGDPSGPYATEAEALADAQDIA